MTVLLAFLHHLAAFTLAAALALEFVLIKQDLTLANVRRLQAADAVLGAAAAVLLIVGLSRVMWFEKGPAYYFSNHAFLGKLSLFVVVAGLSIVPTIEFLKWRKATEQGRLPDVSAAKLRTMRMIIHVELAAIVFILLFAAMMARA